MPVLADARGWFTLEVPDGWDMKTEDSVTTLRSPHGGGVVYLSGARHMGGPQPSFGRADFLSRFLALLGIVTPGFLLRNFRYAVLVITIAAAIITPTTDVTNLVLFAVPMLGLYLLGTGLAWLVWRGRRKREAHS